MNIKTFYGKIRLVNGGHPIVVSVTATSNQVAKKVIESQYSGQIQSWVTQMSSNA